MKKLLLLLILSFLSIQSFAGSCPDGSEPVKSVSEDGSYFVYKCASNSNNDEQVVSSEIQAKINILMKDSPYEELSHDVLNPDRGFYNDLKNGNLEYNYYNKRQAYQPFVTAKDYIANNPITRIEDLRITAPIRKEWLVIDKFYDRELSAKYLEDLKEYFEDARRHKLKIIPRWNYTHPNQPFDRNHALYVSKKYSNKQCQIGSCPWKYQTAEIEYMKRHIQQIAPIVNQYKDVISFVEMGFIGAWGEWQDDKYGQPAAKFGGKSGWWHPARADVVKTWLNNTDDDVYFALRYPSDFIRSEIQELDGFTRVGLHHDCPNYQDDTYPRYNIVAKNAPQGGEFCEIKASNNYSCQTMIKYFETYQFDALRASWPLKIFNGFMREGCLNEIRNRLGYRFVLMGSSYTDGKLTFVIKNKGFGKSFKSRKLSVKVGDQIIETKIDVKNWKPGNTYLEYVDIGPINSESVCLEIEDEIRFANKSGNEIILNNKATGKCGKDNEQTSLTAKDSNDDIVVLKSNKKVNLDGKKISKYQNGVTKSEVYYKDGKREGKFTTWYQSGEIKSEINYKNNLKENKGTSWYVNGQKKAETNYKNGKKEGKSSVWFQSGEIKSEINYKNNSREGKGTSWYVNGQKNAETIYKNGNKEGKSIAWHDNGQIKLEESYIDDKREGIRTTWYINGQKMYEDNFTNGKLDGKKTNWHDNGQIKSEDNYQDGIRI